MNAVNITSLKGWDLSKSHGSCCDWEGVSCDSVSAQIQGIFLSNKGLSGSLSQGLANIPSLQDLDVSNNYLYGPLPQDLSTLSSLHTLDVSSNKFTGQLSDVFKNFRSTPSKVGALAGLRVINLSFNNLSGNIPEMVANMTNLRLLDLSHNSLTGKIPLSLTNLTNLCRFSVSYNQLEGLIPLGNNFSTFSNQSYEGNPRLCGAPLTIQCENEVNPNYSSSRRNSSIVAIDILEPIGVVIGYVAVLVGWLTWKLTRRKIGLEEISK